MNLEILSHFFFLPLLAAAAVAFILAPVVIAIYQRFNWFDDPATKKHSKVIHTYPVPRGGGIVIFAALVAGVVWFLGIDKHTIGIMVGAFILMLVGILDDITDLNPYLRLFLGILAAGVVVMAGIGIAFVTNPFGGVINLTQPQIAFWLLGKTRTIWVLSDIFALLWIVWTMNIVNWSKGLDGQLPGVVVIAAIIIGVLSLRFTADVTQWNVTVLAAITAGAFLGFLPWNFYPQRMMPGYGASSIAGYLLAVLSILSGAKLATMILVLGIPMLDAVYVILRRISQGKSPVWGDRGHFHHKLLDIGWGKRRIAVFYWLMTFSLGMLALQLNARQKAFTIVLLGLGFGAVLLWLNYFISSSKRPGRDNG